ncbi:MAG TPA: hypothetical protein PLD09_05770 [Methanomassiliicoccaceae archaeon]|nr:hypothetical protein [Methanomassiliicoccaceae archaeon]
MATRHSRMVFPRPLRHLVLIIALIALTASVAAAHVPQFSGGGEGLDNARVVNDPTKSWVIYTTYDGPDHVDYYKMSFKEGELMLVGVIVPVTEGERGLAPSMVLMGPGLDDNGTIPSPVQRADGGFMSLDPEEPSKPVYEPFSPSAFYELISIEMLAPADGDYYVAIYDGEIGGDYGLVVGKRESFTVVEWLTTPISLLTVSMGGAAVVDHTHTRGTGLPHRHVGRIRKVVELPEESGCQMAPHLPFRIPYDRLRSRVWLPDGEHAAAGGGDRACRLAKRGLHHRPAIAGSGRIGDRASLHLRRLQTEVQVRPSDHRGSRPHIMVRMDNRSCVGSAGSVPPLPLGPVTAMKPCGSILTSCEPYYIAQ